MGEPLGIQRHKIYIEREVYVCMQYMHNQLKKLHYKNTTTVTDTSVGDTMKISLKENLK